MGIGDHVEITRGAVGLIGVIVLREVIPAVPQYHLWRLITALGEYCEHPDNLKLL